MGTTTFAVELLVIGYQTLIWLGIGEQMTKNGNSSNISLKA